MKREFKNQAALDAFLATGELQGTASHVLVLHDNACTPGVCVCEPSFVVEELTIDNYLAGQQAQAKWVKEKTS